MGAQLILLFITAVMVSGRFGKIHAGNQNNNQEEIKKHSWALMNLIILHLILWWGGWYNVFVQ